MRYRLLLWDFDGTLADTLELSVRLFNGLAFRYGFRPIADAQAARGLSTLGFLRAHRISLAKLPVFRKEFLFLQKTHMEEVRLFAGLPEVLQAIDRNGIRQAVLSSNAEANIRTCLRGHGLENLFAFIVSYPRILGKGRGIRRVLQTQAVDPAELLYIGDEVRDIEAAHRAGVDSAAVTWGFQTPAILADYSPTYQITHPAEILNLLEQANRKRPRRG